MPWARVSDDVAAQPTVAGPNGRAYPRAEVVRRGPRTWQIKIHVDPSNTHILLHPDKRALRAMSFATQSAAMGHAAREVHALRARRHPAGQSWLRGGGQ